MVLVVGSTGLVGAEVCRKLITRGKQVRALVRTTSEPQRVAQMKALGIELAYGDLKDPESLARACRGVDAVISTASSTVSRAEGDSIETVDHAGQLNLVRATKDAGTSALSSSRSASPRVCPCRLLRQSPPWNRQLQT